MFFLISTEIHLWSHHRIPAERKFSSHACIFCLWTRKLPGRRCDSSTDTQTTDGRARTRAWRPMLFPASPEVPEVPGTDVSLLLFRDNKHKTWVACPKRKHSDIINDLDVRAPSTRVHTSGQLGGGQVTQGKKSSRTGTDWQWSRDSKEGGFCATQEYCNWWRHRQT